jgi:hypothetical protein
MAASKLVNKAAEPERWQTAYEEALRHIQVMEMLRGENPMGEQRSNDADRVRSGNTRRDPVLTS